MTTHPQNPTLQTRLRLVRPPMSALTPARHDEPAPARAHADEVARANRSASTLGVDELREAFSARVAESLEGGRSAILRPERRKRLVDLGTRMGIRAFDAHLLIALTQDAARRGEVAMAEEGGAHAAPARLGRGTDSRVVLAASVVLGLCGAMLAIAWFLQG